MTVSFHFSALQGGVFDEISGTMVTTDIYGGQEVGRDKRNEKGIHIFFDANGIGTADGKCNLCSTEGITGKV